MATPKTITIDASNAAGGVNLDTYFATYFAGTEDRIVELLRRHQRIPLLMAIRTGHKSGSATRTRANAATNKQVLIEGENLAYDFAHYGRTKGHGISGTIESITFGTRETRSGCRADRTDRASRPIWRFRAGTSAREPGAGNNVGESRLQPL